MKLRQKFTVQGETGGTTQREVYTVAEIAQYALSEHIEAERNFRAIAEAGRKLVEGSA